MANDGLGLNREGTRILCFAWGESEAPECAIAADAAEVREFILSTWLEGPSEEVDAAMEEIAEHDWADGQKEWRFEIGGIWFADVFPVEVEP